MRLGAVFPLRKSYLSAAKHRIGSPVPNKTFGFYGRKAPSKKKNRTNFPNQRQSLPTSLSLPLTMSLPQLITSEPRKLTDNSLFFTCAHKKWSWDSLRCNYGRTTSLWITLNGGSLRCNQHDRLPQHDYQSLDHAKWWWFKTMSALPQGSRGVVVGVGGDTFLLCCDGLTARSY